MASRSDSKRKYSWWWDSHISPKNSKWLQENLTDMDTKVKQMIKLIEEDADSFARRAEMYYKKRPELMKLVEEFYRAYRALAERYDHATIVIRQAHKTMAEAFPNQVPFMLGDDSPASATDVEPRTPDMPPIRAPFDPDELQNDALGISQSPHAFKRNGAFTDESDSVPGRRGLKQLNDLFGSAEGRARKGLSFHDAAEEEQNSGRNEIKARVPSDCDRMSKAEMEIVSLKNALAKLEAEKEAGLFQYQQSLERLSNLESEVSRAKEDSQGLNERASKAEAEVQTLKEALTKLEAEKEFSFLQYQQCLEKIAKLEYSVSHAQNHAGELDERASKAEVEAQSLRQELAKLEAEKEDALLQYKQCLEKISDLENKLLHAENNAMRFNERADKAEKEVETLKQVVARLTEEKEDAAVQYQQCLDTISVLEHKLASALEAAQRLNSEIDDEAVKLKGAEERCLLLEKSNQTMHSELESQAQKMASQTEELTEKQKELGRLWTCIQEERLRFVEAETAFQTLQHLHSQSQEELRPMAAEIKSRTQMLQDLEARNQILQNEIEEVKVENKGLTEVNLSSALTIQGLQDEISSLRETIGKLEAEVELRLDQRNALQQEIYCLKEELNDLSKKHLAIMEQVESIGFSPESLASSVKNLQDENTKLQEVCEKERSEKVALLEKMAIMEKLMEKNALLENSLSDLNVELQEVREKVRALEESCQSLLAEKSTLVSEKATLVTQLQIATDNLDKLTEKNNFLENSLFDASAEVEVLRASSKSLQDSFTVLENEKSDLTAEKGYLVSQLGIAQKRLEEVEKNYMELEERCLGLEKERQSSLNEVEELRTCLDAQKQEYTSLVRLSESQLANMAAQICLLQEKGQCIKKEYEENLDDAFSAQTEIFILQKCVQDLEDNNFSLLFEFKKLLEASKLSKKLISELEHENLEQQAEVNSLYDQIKVLRVGLYRVLRTLELDTNQWCESKAEQDQVLLNNALAKLQETRKDLFEMQDENQQMLIENSIVVTLLGQLQQEVGSLVKAKNALNEELACRSVRFSVLQSESQKLSETNEVLNLKIMEGDLKEEVLKDELENLQGQLIGLRGAYKMLHEGNCKVLDEKRYLMNSISELEQEKSNLEDENCQVLTENSIVLTLLGQLQQGVENLVKAKNSLDEELACRAEQFSVLQSESQKLSEANEVLNLKIMEGDIKEAFLKDERENLQGQLMDLKGAYKMLQEGNSKVLDEKRSLMNSISELEREKSNLEDENCKMLTENSIIFTLLGQLKQELESLMKAKNTLDEELVCRTEQFSVLQSESQRLSEMNELFGLKIMEGDFKEELLKDKVQNLQEQLIDLQGTYKMLQEDNRKVLDEKISAMNSIAELGRERSNLEVENCALFAETAYLGILSLIFRDIISDKCLEIEELSKELECIREANLKLESVLQILNEELIEAKSREGSLNYELQRGRNEVEQWESQAAATFGELQTSAVQQALFEGKVHELIGAYESLDSRICLKDVDIDQLKERACSLESENEELKTQMTSYIPAFISLRDSVTSLENHTLSYATLHEVENKETKDVEHVESSPKISEEKDVMGPGKILNLEGLQKRIRAIEEAVTERERLFILEISSATSKLEAANGQIEEWKSRKSFRRERRYGSRNPEDKELRHEASGSWNEVMTKDIMLDQISESSSHGIGRRETLERDDQMLEIWETTEQDASIDLNVGKSQKATASRTEKKRNKEHPSRESMIEKDVSVDKLEISRRLSRSQSGSRQEMSERKILERLDSDAQKLTNLQITVQDLKRKVEITEKNKKGKGIEYDSVKEQLEESEEAIMKLFDVNRKLVKNIEDESSFDEKSELAYDENGSVRRRRISEQARRGSEKIGRLQLEVQKLQFLLLKLDDENRSRVKAKIVERKTRVLLRDYLYGGTRTGQKKKKRHFCACVQPPTEGD